MKVLGLAALAACDGGGTGPVVPSGSASFRFSGGLPTLFTGGSFSASGAPELDASGRPGVQAWAVAGSHPTNGPLVPPGSKLAVVAFSPRGGQGDLLVLTLPRVSGPTSVQIDDHCAAVNCTRGLILLGVSPHAPHDGVRGACEFSTGTVQITSVSGGRVRGTFAATGWCTVDLRTSPVYSITVPEGEFDVPISEEFRTGLQIWS